MVCKATTLVDKGFLKSIFICRQNSHLNWLKNEELYFDAL